MLRHSVQYSNCERFLTVTNGVYSTMGCPTAIASVFLLPQVVRLERWISEGGAGAEILIMCFSYAV